MKLVVSSDWHLDWHTDGFPRFNDVGDAVQKVVMHSIGLKQQGHDVVFVFLGDLTNPFSSGQHRASAFVVEVVVTLHAAGIRSLWLSGNHDVIEDGFGSHTLLPLKHLESLGATLADSPGVYHVGGLSILCLPFTPTSHTYDPAQVVEECDEPPDVIAGHLSIQGILGVGSETKDMPRGRDILFPVAEARDNFPKALLMNGHYHRQQVFKKIHIPGSLARLTHSEEENENCFMVFDR